MSSRRPTSRGVTSRRATSSRVTGSRVSWSRAAGSPHATPHLHSRRRQAAALLVIAAIAAVLSAAHLSGSGQPQDNGADNTGAPHSPPTGLSEAKDADVDPVPGTILEQAAVELPAGSSNAEGHPVGFPRTELGAVAVPVALNRAQIGFDYDQAAAVADLYTAPSDRTSVLGRAAAAVASRRNDLSVPIRGAVPAPASFALTPYAFEATALEPDRYAVSVLSLISSTDTSGRSATVLYAGTQVVAWSASDEDEPAQTDTARSAAEMGQWPSQDWKVVEPDSTDEELLATLPQPTLVGPEDPDRLTGAGWTPLAAQTSTQTSTPTNNTTTSGLADTGNVR